MFTPRLTPLLLALLLASCGGSGPTHDTAFGVIEVPMGVESQNERILTDSGRFSVYVEGDFRPTLIGWGVEEGGEVTLFEDGRASPLDPFEASMEEDPPEGRLWVFGSDGAEVRWVVTWYLKGWNEGVVMR